MDINSNTVSWKDITREQLKYLLVDKDMSTSSIAEMFNVSVSQVKYKRDKFKLKQTDVIFERMALENKSVFDILDESSKEWFMDPQNIDSIAKAITLYAFRNGPIEDVHRSCKDLTDEKMKEINIYMVNHIAGLLTYAFAGNWTKLRTILGYVNQWGNAWEPAKPETDKLDKLFNIACSLSAASTL